MTYKKNSEEQLIKLFRSQDGGLFKPILKEKTLTEDDRLIHSFNKITEFVEENSRVPELNSGDIKEASLAQRLESIRSNKTKIQSLDPVDKLGLLQLPPPPKSIDELFRNDNFDLFGKPEDQIFNIKNIPSSPRKSIEPVARRKKAPDFDKFRDGFISIQNGLQKGDLKLTRYYTVNQLNIGDYYIHDNQMLRIVGVGSKKRVYDRNKERFRIIFENGTESDMYRRSLSQRLYENGYWIIKKDYLNENISSLDNQDIRGRIYILASKSQDPKISTIKDLYKIGFSTVPVKERIKKADNDPTYLMAPVRIIDSYVLTGDYKPQKVEHLIHRIFSDATLDIELIDNQGNKYTPQEWYSVPLRVIQQAIALIQSREITNFKYDGNNEKLIPVED